MILLDTNIVISLFNGNEVVEQKLNEYSARETMISFVTLGELVFGAHRSKRTEKNLLKINEFSRKIEVAHSDEETASIYGKLKDRSIKMGRFPVDHDLWIAATALIQKACLVTHNTRHFRWIEGLHVENWLEPGPPPNRPLKRGA